MKSTTFVLFQLIGTLVSIALRVIGKLRLAIPFLYTVLMCSVFSKWSAENEGMAIGILIALLAAVAASWLVTLVRKVRMNFF